MILHDTFAATPLDRTSLPQSGLDIAERVRTNPFPWAGQFSPQLVISARWMKSPTITPA